MRLCRENLMTNWNTGDLFIVDKGAWWGSPDDKGSRFIESNELLIFLGAYEWSTSYMSWFGSGYSFRWAFLSKHGIVFVPSINKCRSTIYFHQGFKLSRVEL